MNLLSTMIGVAIVAILSAVAVPDWIQTERDATLSSAAEEWSSARLALEQSAAETAGATLAVNGSSIAVTSGSGVVWSGHLPNGATVAINGVAMGCVSLNGEEIPVTSLGCSTTPSTPMTWSARFDGQTQTIS